MAVVGCFVSPTGVEAGVRVSGVFVGTAAVRLTLPAGFPFGSGVAFPVAFPVGFRGGLAAGACVCAAAVVRTVGFVVDG